MHDGHQRPRTNQYHITQKVVQKYHKTLIYTLKVGEDRNKLIYLINWTHPSRLLFSS